MKLLAIDGNSIVNRAFYAIRALSNTKGIYTNAILGFMNIYLKAISEVQPDCVAIAFDVKSPTFRHIKVESYKATRKGMPEELAMQMPILKDLLDKLGLKYIECEGFEADDILGTLARVSTETSNECVIMSGDRDTLQLINENVKIRLATTKENIDFTRERFVEQYGFQPLSLVDCKALMGDSSDNISGVKGIGEKTASTLMQKWATIENLYENIDNLGVSAGVKQKLIDGKSVAFECKWLATIVSNAPINEEFSYYSLANSTPDFKAVADLLTELEMNKLLQRIREFHPIDSSPIESITVPEVKEALLTGELLDNLLKVNESLPYIFTDGNQSLLIFSENTIYTCEDKELILEFMTSNILKQTFNAKESYKLCLKNGKILKGIDFDGAIAGYILNPNMSSYTIENLCNEYNISYFSQFNTNADIVALGELARKLTDEIEKINATTLFKEIELPLTEVLASMEVDGILLDLDGIENFGNKLWDDIKSLEERIYFMADEEFNISSPKQLGDILFEKMQLPRGKKTKTGYSTNAEILEKLRNTHPIINEVISYRQLTKLHSTYIKGLKKAVASDGKIHSSFKQTETRTGRISSTDPNMQNIPVRTELGRNMRKFFVAREGYTLLDADYSQIELRILAHMSDDENMQKAFIEGVDIHTLTASQVFNLPIGMVTSQMRSSAKAVNFGIIYGISAFSLSDDIGVSMAEAKKYIQNYLDRFPNVDRYMKNVISNATANGYCTTLFGRIRPIPELSSDKKLIQSFGERVAMNAPIQGTAADIIKIAMIRVHNRLREENLDARLILQVHDELIVEASLDCKDRAAEILGEEMAKSADLKVPLISDVNEGKSWYDAKG